MSMTINNLKVRVADWHSEKEKLSKIRRQVFVEEQNVPEELEWDEYDDSSTHFLATLDNKVVATARLKPDGQIGRMAVLSEYRNQGVGSALLQLVLENAGSQNLKQVYLHAQVDAIAFYEKHGFTTQGGIFYEADIPHRAMLKKHAK